MDSVDSNIQITMNNQIIRNHYDAFDRMKAFRAKHGSLITAGSRAAGLFTGIGTVVATLEEHGVKKISGTASYQGGAESRRIARELVLEDLRAIRNTAEAISEADDLPEFDEQFRLPRSGSAALLLMKAKAFLQDATPHKDLFIEFELPEDFLEDLEADIALLEKAKDDKEAGLSEQVAGTAELSAATLAGIKLRKQLLPIMRNKFRGQPGILAEWETAIHIVRPDRKAEEEKAQIA